MSNLADGYTAVLAALDREVVSSHDIYPGLADGYSAALKHIMRGLSPDRPTALYRHFGAGGELLYVGVSLTVLSRLEQHRYGAKWFDHISTIRVEWFETRKMALDAETAAIKSERPIHNVTHNTTRCLPTATPSF